MGVGCWLFSRAPTIIFVEYCLGCNLSGLFFGELAAPGHTLADVSTGTTVVVL